MTEHIEAKIGEIAKTVIMPGDPLRAKMIASKFLTDYKLVNSVRGILAYTGYYNGKLVTIMASGMGMGSMGIYSYELYKYYDVDRIIRIGTAGAYTTDLKLYDTVLATSVYTDSNFAYVQNKENINIINGFNNLNNKIIESANKLGIVLKESCVHSSDVFYKMNDNFKELNELYNCTCVEMESFALFNQARLLNKEAACLLTISNSLVTGDTTTSEERQNKFLNMIEVALNTL
ncbi:MAG: purine-nucleoside phosphorylase [Bacilli bacterium]|nr:purine-nucleoside phosphorylase [Bacilli bacterium]